MTSPVGILIPHTIDLFSSPLVKYDQNLQNIKENALQEAPDQEVMSEEAPVEAKISHPMMENKPVQVSFTLKFLGKQEEEWKVTCSAKRAIEQMERVKDSHDYNLTRFVIEDGNYRFKMTTPQTEWGGCIKPLGAIAMIKQFPHHPELKNSGRLHMTPEAILRMTTGIKFELPKGRCVIS